VKVWLNGSLVDGGEAKLSVFDHGFTVGDGVFETVKAVDGRPFALTRHLDRLAASAGGLGLPDPDRDLLRGAVDQVLAANDVGALGRIRITYTGGVSPLGSERGTAGPTMVVAAVPMRPWPESTAVATVPWTRNERSPVTGIKTTSYAENVVMLAHAHRHGASEAVFANTAGNLCEGTGSNVFVALDGRLVTPPLAAGCLAGVTRALLLEWVGADEDDVPIAALGEADEVFLASTTRNIQPVHRVDDRALPETPGPLTRKAMEVFAVRSGDTLDP
jgi:branched-chain amino acid aminotransferase